MQMNSTEARKAINDHIATLQGVAVAYGNQPDFKPPSSGVWSRITLQYSDTTSSGLLDGLLERDNGFINIQCFAKKGTGEKALFELADKWRAHFRGFGLGMLEVTKTHAPTPLASDLESDFIMSLVRIEFRVN